MDFRKTTKEEELSLLKEKSIDELKDAYRPLAEKVVSKYDSAVPEELVAKALEPMKFAREKYLSHKPEERNFKFSTYFTWFMREACEGRG